MALSRRELLAAGITVPLGGTAPRITDPPDGAILNRHDGTPAPHGLEISVSGECAPGAQVSVDGRPAKVTGSRFEARVELRSQENPIEARAGGGRHRIVVLWDRHSFPRYRVSTDDNIRFLQDLARNAESYASLFDNPYLAFWREMHRKYAAKVHFNIYYEMPGFNLAQMPVRYKSEWKQNAGWIRLSFHARANDPDRPYLGAPASQVLDDYRLVTREIERFAGRELLSPVTTVHWGETTREAALALRREGVRVMLGYFLLRQEKPVTSYYLDTERTRYLSGRDYWKDRETEIIFVRHDVVMNSGPLSAIVPHLERIAADPHQSEIFELMIHEQYFYPDYRAYEPDYRERVERAIEWVTRKGYRPVFYSDGFLGAPAGGNRNGRAG